jgi:CheY-like chemotaxis protein
MAEVHLMSLGPAGEGGEETAAVQEFPFIIGRHPDCDCRVDDPLVSRHHCVLTERDGRVWVEDLGSTNGTHLNGQRLDEPLPLDDGDRLDVGSRAFRVRLGAAPATRAGSSRPGLGRPVLVVEDNKATAQALVMLLQSWGHRVRVAYDGPEAIEEAREEPPEVVLVDIGLPSMSGVEVARRLRTEVGLKQARMLAVTGNAGATDVLQSRGQFERLLLKPVSPQVLREAVGGAC